MSTMYKYQFIANGTDSIERDFGDLIAGGTGNPLLEGKDPDSAADFQAYVEGAEPNGLGVTIDTDAGGVKLIFKNFTEVQAMSRSTMDADDIVGLDDFINDHTAGEDGVTKTYAGGIVTFSGGTPVYDEPRISNFTIDIASRVDLNTDLNVSHNITYNVLHYANIATLVLTVTTGDNKVLTIPTANGSTGQAVTLSGITTSSETTVTFQITGTDSRGGTFGSNIVSIDVRDLDTHEYLYDDLSTTNNPATIDTATMDQQEVTGTAGQVLTVSTGAVTEGDYFIILVRAVHTITIFDTVLQQDVTNIFTKTDDVRVINTHQFDSYVVGPLRADATGESYTVTIVS